MPRPTPEELRDVLYSVDHGREREKLALLAEIRDVLTEILEQLKKREGVIT